MNPEPNLVLLRYGLVDAASQIGGEHCRCVHFGVRSWDWTHAWIRAEHTFVEGKVKRMQELAAQHGELKLGFPTTASCAHLEVVFLSLQYRVLHEPVVFEGKIDGLFERKDGRSSVRVRRLRLPRRTQRPREGT